MGGIQFSSVTQSCPTLSDPMNHSTPGLPVHHGTLGVPLEAPSVSANFCGLIKGVKYRFTLKDGTWDFPGDLGREEPLEKG